MRAEDVENGVSSSPFFGRATPFRPRPFHSRVPPTGLGIRHPAAKRKSCPLATSAAVKLLPVATLCSKRLRTACKASSVALRFPFPVSAPRGEHLWCTPAVMPSKGPLQSVQVFGRKVSRAPGGRGRGKPGSGRGRWAGFWGLRGSRNPGLTWPSSLSLAFCRRRPQPWRTASGATAS